MCSQISIKVKYSLTDPTGQKVACVQVSAKIVDPNPKSSSRTRSKSLRNKTNKKTNEKNDSKSEH